MKKYIIIFLLFVGFSEYSFGQKTTFHQNGFEKLTKKKHHRKNQITHFKKQSKDKKLASNGTKVKNKGKYKVDKRSFTSVNKIKDNKKFVRESSSMRKHYQGTLRETVYATSLDGGSHRRALLRGR